MSTPGSVTRAAEKLLNPVGREEAAEHIWKRYVGQLLQLARHQLDSRVKVRADEDDVVQDAFHSFFRRLESGRLEFHNRDDITRLLTRITICKALNVANRNTAEKRDVSRELMIFAQGPDDSAIPPAVLDCMDHSAPDPAAALAMQEEAERLLTMLPRELRQIVSWKMQGYTNDEIGRKLDRTERTVELKLQLIRAQWQSAAPI
jgi:RNA polymerase sigma-70 factor (ECF subfamily)